MNAPLLTIVTITKDDPRGLVRTLGSAAALRSAREVEHLVVYHGVIASGCSDDSVIMLRQKSAGIAEAFNEGWHQAHGEWVWFLNGGDQVDPRLTAEHLRVLLNLTRADIVIGGITYEGEVEVRLPPPRALQWPPIRSWIPHPATLVRRSLFERFGGFDPRYSIAMDYEWWLRALSTNVAVDVLTIPFALFAAGGLSQRPETRKLIVREQRYALRRHLRALWWPMIGMGCRLAHASVLALFAPRIKNTGNMSGGKR